MTDIQAIILGIIQGLTEFLPVSSSGHLVIGQHLFGLAEPELLFDVAVHIGTLLAVCLYFRIEIAAIFIAVCRWPFDRRSKNPGPVPMTPEARMGFLILAGSIPTAVIGLLLRDKAELLFSSVFLVGFMLIGTGGWMWFTRRLKPSRSTDRFSWGKALLIGTIQGVAVIPGISRSGATIAAGLYLGLNRDTAARYSFLLSIPAIAGAALISLRDFSAAGTASMDVVLIGATVASLVGYGALSFLVYIVKKGNLYLFAPYCWAVGLLCIALAR